MGDHYLTLGVDRRASEREIARAHRRLARRYHPDVSATPALTLDLFLAVQDAYETLSDARRRASYDAELGRREQHVPPPPASFVAQPARAPSRVVVREVRYEQPPPDAQPSTMALLLVAAAAVALLAALALENALAGGTRFLWAGICAALGVVASLLARSIAARQLDLLWRWTARGGRRMLRGSAAARAAHHRIQLADDVTLLGRRAVLLAIPIVFLLARR
jgi:hypothetical protein